MNSVRIKKEYSTHMPVLIKLVQHTCGPIAELGSGLYSTPLLHWLCAEEKRPLVTYESIPGYYEQARKFSSRNHTIRFVKNWNDIDIKTHWSVALIDQDSERGKTALLLKNNTDFIILHDSEHENVYGYDKVWPDFKYRFDWKACKPWTSVVSNFQDLSWLTVHG